MGCIPIMTEWFYSKGGQQNGPVSQEALAELARSGSLDPRVDLVWNSSMSDWTPAGKIPGLFEAPAAAAPVETGAPAGAAPAADPSNPYAAPQSAMEDAAPDPGVALEEIIPGSEPFDVMACVKRGFDLTVRNFGTILLIGLVYIGVSIASSLVFGGIDSALGFGGQRVEQVAVPFGDGATTTTTTRTGGPFALIFGNIFSIFLALGIARVGLNLVSGREVRVGMLFGEGRKLLKGVVAMILFGLAVGLGLVLLIVPGIYIAVRYGQFMNAIVDRDLGIMESFHYSSSLTTNNRWNIVLLWLMTIAITIAGCLALVIGLVFAYPVIWLSWLAAYRWMQYGHRAVMDQPGTTEPMLNIR